MSDDIRRQFDRTEDLTDIKIKQIEFNTRLESIERSVKIPFYSDRRFWAGVCAIPVLILGGWTVDKLFVGKPIALGLIHQALGTQPVILDAIKTRLFDLGLKTSFPLCSQRRAV
jgi:hypothetical protein